MKLNETLRKIRISAGITQNNIADYLGVNRASYSNYETGKRLPDIDTLVKIADFYKVSLDQLLTREIKVKAVTVQKEINFKTQIHKEVWNKLNELDEGMVYIVDGYLDGLIEKSKREDLSKNKKNIV